MTDDSRPQGNKERILQSVASLAGTQYGLVTRSQIRSLGLSERSLDRRIATGQLATLHPGVYRVVGAPTSWEQAVLGACLRTDGLASHRTAAALWGLSGIESRGIEVTTARQVRPAGVTIHRSRLRTDESTRLGPIPLTTPARTLLDVGGLARRTVVEAAVTDALRQRLITLPRLDRYLTCSGGRGRPGAEVLRSIVQSLRNHPVESILELRLMRVLRRYRLPQPVAQFRIQGKDRVVARVDFAYPEVKLAIEADGYRFHGDAHAWRKDLERRNALTSLGWHVVHVTWADLSDRPRVVISQILEALEAVGGLTVQASLLGNRR